MLAQVDVEMDEHITTIHLVCDHVSTHHGQAGRQWWVKPPRCVVPFTPVHCAWMHQVEPWFSIFQRQRLRSAEVEAKEPRQSKIDQCIRAWHEHAQPFNWSTTSVATVMAKVPAMAA